MSYSTAKSERITAIVSTLVAVAILAGGVTAYQSRQAPVDDVVQLESDLRFQLEVAFRHDPNERAARLLLLEQVSQDWQQSTHSTADGEKFASWLLEATIRSMPGSIEALPELPEFGTTQPQPLAEETPEVLVEPPIVGTKLVVERNPIVERNPVVERISESVALVPTPAPFVSADETDAAEVGLAAIAEVERPALFAQGPRESIPTQRLLPADFEVVASVQINLTELAARIAGYHEGLDEIERTLLSLDAGDFPALTEQVAQLAELTLDFQFVAMYYEALTNDERRAVVAPRPMTDILAEIERRIDRTHDTQSGDFLGEFDSSNQDRIDELRELLAEITLRVER